LILNHTTPVSTSTSTITITTMTTSFILSSLFNNGFNFLVGYLTTFSVSRL
jgi:hypothetical protein